MVAVDCRGSSVLNVAFGQSAVLFVSWDYCSGCQVAATALPFPLCAQGAAQSSQDVGHNATE